MINQIFNQEPIKYKHIPIIQHEFHALIPLVKINTLNLYNRLIQNHLCQIVKNMLHIEFHLQVIDDGYKITIILWL